MNRKAWQATVHGIAENRTQLNTLTGSDIAEHTHTHTHEKMCDLQKTSPLTGARETCFFLFVRPPADSSTAAAALSFVFGFFFPHTLAKH